MTKRFASLISSVFAMDTRNWHKVTDNTWVSICSVYSTCSDRYSVSCIKVYYRETIVAVCDQSWFTLNFFDVDLCDHITDSLLSTYTARHIVSIIDSGD